jgi:NADH-quinone oxidoreductase subunit M
LLGLVTFLPLTAGLLLLSTGRQLPVVVWRAAGLLASFATFGLALGLWVGYDAVDGGYQFVERLEWLPEFGIHYFVGIDGISLPLVLLTTFLVPLAMLATFRDIEKSARSYIFFMLFLETGMLGAFVSLNLFVFYIFWEVMLIPMYFLVGIWGGPRRVYAAIKFFLFTMLGSMLMFLALLVVYRLNFEQGGGVLNFDWVGLPGSHTLGILDTRIPLAGAAEWWRTQPVLFAAFAIAFAVKVPMVPFHTWLPDAHVEAPTGASVVLAGVLLKLGAYGFLRFALPLFPDAAIAATPLILGIAVTGIVYGSLIAMVQRDIKRLVAYSSIAHLGFVILGIFAFNSQGISGGVLQMVSHGLATGALFILIGFLYRRRQTRDIDDFGGVARPMPVFAALFGVVMMASIGLPGLSGFAGEFLILLGTFSASPWIAALACSGLVLGAAYMLWMYRRVMLGPVANAENRGLIDLDWLERSVIAAIILPILWIGVQPDSALRRIEPAAVATLRIIDERRQERVPGTGDSGWPSAPGEIDAPSEFSGDEIAQATTSRLVWPISLQTPGPVPVPLEKASLALLAAEEAR